MSAQPSVAQLLDESQSLERAGEIAAALQRAQAAVEQARADGDAQTLAAALNSIAFVHFRMGHYAQARALAEEALTHAAADSPARADALLLLGMCATETNDLAAGEDFYLRAIDLSRQLGYHRALSRGLHNLSAGVYMPRGQFELALATDAEALRLAKEKGMLDLVWAPLIIIAWVYWITGRRDQATATLNELRRVALPGSGAEGYYFCVSGNLALDEGALDQVPSLYARARSIGEASGEPSINVLARLGMSRYHRTIGDASAAREWANDALTIATRVGYQHFQGIALVERGRAAWAIGDLATAEADLCAAIEILNTLGAAFDLTRARFFLAALLHEQERDEAVSAWRDAARSIIAGNYAFLLEQERGLAFPLVATYLSHTNSEIAALSATLVSHLERVPPPPLHILTLGRFEVRQGNRRIADQTWRQRRAGELFRLLLVSPGHSLSHDEIIETFWPNKPSGSTQALFHQATSALRRAIEPELPDRFPSRYLQVEEGRVTLYLPPGSSVDFEAFEQHIRAEEWEAALALYQGELFPDDRYADWAAIPRERLQRLYLRALLMTAQRQMQMGHPREALDTCHRILEIDSWQEEAVFLGMRAYLMCNDRAGALRLYQELERTLREELNTTPQAQLRELYESLIK